jgi:hypothetical protein
MNRDSEKNESSKAESGKEHVVVVLGQNDPDEHEQHV